MQAARNLLYQTVQVRYSSLVTRHSSLRCQSLELLYVEDPHGCAADLHVDWAGHIEFCRVEGGGVGGDVLGAGVAACLYYVEGLIEGFIGHAHHEGGVALAQEATCAVNGGEAYVVLAEGVAQAYSVLALHYCYNCFHNYKLDEGQRTKDEGSDTGVYLLEQVRYLA